MNRIAFAAATCGVGVGCALASVQPELIYATTLQGNLISFRADNPANLLSGVAIQGLQPNEVVRGIDFRPATGELFALGSFDRLYRLNPETGQATLAAAISLTTAGSAFGFDFNPTNDLIRVLSPADQSLRINPTTGAAVLDGDVAFAAGDDNFGEDPNLVHAAYANNRPNAGSTTLFVIDAALDVLGRLNPATGALTTVGELGVDITEQGGFDISGATDIAYATFRGPTPDRSLLYTINLTTGFATEAEEIGGGVLVTSMAVLPAPGTVATLAVTFVAFARRRRSH
ncbi:MAG: DUF4394 domain-containing protein [Planctomycetota bacterium]|nr:DUF4394 domain-containing protein [Planctomycetota bacterium]